MKKALLVATVSRQFTLFDFDNILILHSLGYQVHCAASYDDASSILDRLPIIRHNISIQRSPYRVGNIKAISQLIRIIKSNEFDLVHCHSPMGGFLGRLCARLTNTNNVIYTAHGFHFYKGASWKRNIIYKNIERLAARWTDCIITINNEDYIAANEFKLRTDGKVRFIPGVGVDLDKISLVTVDRSNMRKELRIPQNAFLILSVGELIPRKNNIHMINVTKKLSEKGYNDIYYAICGRGELRDSLEDITKEIFKEKKVFFFGYRNDIIEVMKAADILALPSYQEGLSKSLMEAMAAGLCPIVSKKRGNTDLIKDKYNGMVFDVNDIDSTVQIIETLYTDRSLTELYANRNKELIKLNDIKLVNDLMKNIYMEYL